MTVVLDYSGAGSQSMETQELPEWSSPETIRSVPLPPSSPAPKLELRLRFRRSLRRHDQFLIIIFLLTLIGAFIVVAGHIWAGPG